MYPHPTRWGRWLKQRRPRVAIERIDANLITRYIASCSTFRAKATVYSTLSTMRGFGDYLAPRLTPPEV